MQLGSITLYDGGRQFRHIDIAHLNVDLARSNIPAQENTLRANITRDYFQAVNAEARIALEQQLLRSRGIDWTWRSSRRISRSWGSISLRNSTASEA